MSILESFYILFKSDASDYKKGASDVKKTNKELEDNFNQMRDNAAKAFGQKITPEVNKFQAGLAGAARTLGAFIGGVITLGMVYEHLKQTQERAVTLGREGQFLNVDPGKLEAYGEAVKRYGGSVEGFISSLKNLQEHFGGSAQLALDALLPLSDAVKNISETQGRIQAVTWLKTFGIDDATINLLLQGSEGVKQLVAQMERYGVISKEDQRINLEYANSTATLSQAFRSLSYDLLRDTLPVLTKIQNIIAESIVLYRQLKAATSTSHTTLFTGLLLAGLAIKQQKDKVNSAIGGFIKSALLTAKNFPAIGSPEFGIAKQTINGIAGSAIPTALTNQLNTTTVANRKTHNFHTGPITVNTQVKDAYGFAEALKFELSRQFNQSNANFDDGVAM